MTNLIIWKNSFKDSVCWIECRAYGYYNFINSAENSSQNNLASLLHYHKMIFDNGHEMNLINLKDDMIDNKSDVICFVTYR